ncbi:MAG TPA: class I SAM-dependent methyltransferase [Gemmatimonadales bacterium]
MVESQSSAEWAVALFNRSVLKQAKYRKVLELLDDPGGKTNLDIGADNGVISYLLRRRGGRWYSADLDPVAVASIRELVRDDVYQLNGSAAPFPSGTFDQVVVVDYLEHIADDRGFVRELERILRPGGILILNVPHPKPGSLLTRFRHRIGLTDAWHGHLRPGYSLADLRVLLGPRFTIERAITYSGTFSELVDTGMNGLYQVMQRRKRGKAAGTKGNVVTRDDMEKQRGEFRLLSLAYPFLWTLARMDLLLPFQAGYKLILRARLRPVEG